MGTRPPICLQLLRLAPYRSDRGVYQVDGVEKLGWIACRIGASTSLHSFHSLTWKKVGDRSMRKTVENGGKGECSSLVGVFKRREGFGFAMKRSMKIGPSNTIIRDLLGKNGSRTRMQLLPVFCTFCRCLFCRFCSCSPFCSCLFVKNLFG